MRVFIDNNIWDQFFVRNVDLEAHFPRDKYSLCVTRHGTFEIRQTPDEKFELKEYINKYMGHVVLEDSIFGFTSPNLPSNQQRISGFGVGRFGTKEENEIRSQLALKYGSTKKRRDTQILYQQEADIELATRSIHNPVVTLDVKNGPLKDAMDWGGKVIFINLIEIENLSGDEFVMYIKKRLTEIAI